MTRLKLAVASALSAYLAWTVSIGLRENDTFWHLGLGRAVLEQGTRSVLEPWALRGEYPARCVVPEWLWDVGTYVVYQLSGYVGLQLFMMLAAALLVWALAFALQWARPELPDAAWLSSLTLSTCVVCSRTGERPEQAALSCAALFMGVAVRHARRPQNGWRELAPLFAIGLLWAQLHPTCVLVVPLFAIPQLARWFARDFAGARAQLSLLAACALLPLSSAHGLDIYRYVLLHSAGDAVAHISDMKRTSFDFFNPAEEVFHPLLALSWLGAGVLLARARRFSWESLLFALLGALVTLMAVRGVALGGVLATLWLADGLATLELRTPRRALLGACVLSALVLARLTFRLADNPHLRLGLAREHVPLAAAAWLSDSPRGTRVMSSYTASAPLGFLLEGRVRTWVDSRTPMYFDATDFALQREGLHTPESVAIASRRFAFSAAVVERESEACHAIAQSGLYQLAMTELHYATFARIGTPLAQKGPPLSHFSACGSGFVSAEQCSAPGTLADELRALSALDPVFARFLQAEHLLRCGGDLRSFPELLPQGEDAIGYGPRPNLLLGAALLRIGQDAAAEERLLPLARAGELSASALLVAPLQRQGRADALRDLLLPQARALKDAMPGELMRELGRACLALHDRECASFYLLRAAARGVPELAPLLRALASERGSARATRSAQHYLRALSDP